MHDAQNLRQVRNGIYRIALNEQYEVSSRAKVNPDAYVKVKRFILQDVLEARVAQAEYLPRRTSPKSPLSMMSQ